MNRANSHATIGICRRFLRQCDELSLLSIGAISRDRSIRLGRAGDTPRASASRAKCRSNSIGSLDDLATRAHHDLRNAA
jgi:hypothetical protein